MIFSFFKRKKQQKPPEETCEQEGKIIFEAQLDIFDTNQDPSYLYQHANELAGSLFKFPYQHPDELPASVRNDRHLLKMITQAHKTTIAPDGSTQQTTIDPEERIKRQGQFKKRIYSLLDKCIELDPEYGPAYLLYPKVAEFNTRAKDREFLIALLERLLDAIDQITPGTRAYELIKKEVAGKGQFHEHVEYHLITFYRELARLYTETKQINLARKEHRKVTKLFASIKVPWEPEEKTKRFNELVLYTLHNHPDDNQRTSSPPPMSHTENHVVLQELLRILQFFVNSTHLALSHKKRTVTKRAIDDMKELYKQIKELAHLLYPETEAEIEKFYQKNIENFYTSSFINTATGLFDKAQKLKTSKSKIKYGEQALEALDEGLASGQGSQEKLNEFRQEIEKYLEDVCTEE